jgi:hypothetical protein
MKTARFADLVKAAGKPEPHTLWVEPKQDRELQAALTETRVLSVQQGNAGTKADVGKVGYEAGPETQVLIFPRSIASFRGRKIVGLKYDQLATPRRAPATASSARRHVQKRKAAPPKAKIATDQDEERKRSPRKPPSPRDAKALMRGIKAAMKLLDAGKAVAAYRTLEELV